MTDDENDRFWDEAKNIARMYVQTALITDDDIDEEALEDDDWEYFEIGISGGIAGLLKAVQQRGWIFGPQADD